MRPGTLGLLIVSVAIVAIGTVMLFLGDSNYIVVGGICIVVGLYCCIQCGQIHAFEKMEKHEKGDA